MNTQNRPQNTTILPWAYAEAVAKPEIAEVRSLATGRLFPARDFIEGHRYDKMVTLQIKVRHQMRTATKDNPARFVCPQCGVPVYISTSTQKRFFFKHKIEDGSCPAKTHHPLSYKQINARKYLGARESRPHILAKERIVRSLSADAAFTKVQAEQRITSDFSKRWRRPDVQAKLGDLRIAFEVQLSTTFLDVVLERREFYRDEGMLLVWIMPRFDPWYRRLTDDRTIFMNNSNVLVVDEETTALSEEAKTFLVRVVYRNVTLVEGRRDERWDTEIVPFADLTLDISNQRAFYFDFEGADARIEEEIRQAFKKKDEQLRTRFFEIWEQIADISYEDLEADNRMQFQRVGNELRSRGLSFPTSPWERDKFRRLVWGLLSAREGTPKGFRFEKLVQVAHCLYDNQRDALLYFGHTLRHHGTDTIIKKQDRTNRWSDRSVEIRKALKQRDPTYMPDPTWIETILFLFPEIEANVREYLTKES